MLGSRFDRGEVGEVDFEEDDLTGRIGKFLLNALKIASALTFARRLFSGKKLTAIALSALSFERPAMYTVAFFW